MDMKSITGWVEEHPTESIVIGLGGTLAVLWLLGFFSSSNGNAGASNLASAYYAAEAQQAVVGGQIQMANINATASTAQTLIQANAATAINTANTNAAMTINQQNTGAGIAINQSNNDATTAQTGITANEQLLATYSNNNTALNTTLSNNATAATINASNNQTSWLNNIISTILPAELVQGGGIAHVTGPGGVDLGFGSGPGAYSTPKGLLAAGFSPGQIQNIFGAPYP